MAGTVGLGESCEVEICFRIGFRIKLNELGSFVECGSQLFESKHLSQTSGDLFDETEN